MLHHILICGLGSIGRRHLRHFRELGVERIDAFRTGKATLPDDGQPAPDRIFRNLDEALRASPEGVVIASPTALHVPTARRAVAAGCHVLIEKPLSHDLAGCEALAAEARDARRVVSVAQNLRYHPSLQELKRWIDELVPLGRALQLRAHFGAYLPAWHPWEDYRTSYAARSDLGGGARRTHVHEVDFACWLMGPVERAVGLDAGTSPLGTDVDEFSALVLRHENGALSSLTLSLAERPPNRTVEIAFTAGRSVLDLFTGRLVGLPAEGDAIEFSPPLGFDVDATYRAQAADFARAIEESDDAPVPVDDAIRTLRTALAT